MKRLIPLIQGRRVMKRLLFCLVAAAIMLSAAVQGAAAAGNDWMKRMDAPKDESSAGIPQYAALKAGVYFPEITVNGRNRSFDTGTGFEVGYGIRALRFLAVEGALGYFESDHISDHPDYFNDPVYQLSVFPITITLKAIAPIFNVVELYALGGAGMNYLMLQKKTSTNASNTVVNVKESDEFTNSYHYGGGIGLKLGASSAISVEARRIENLKSTMLGDSFDISGTLLYGTVTLGF
jgi:opacity protein-like surface antigen